MKQVELYTDGACSGNPGPGGWCAVLLYKGHQKLASGYHKDTTNNRMELFAVVQGLSLLKEPCAVKLYSDSAYVINALDKGWLQGWIKAGWRTGDNKEVKNTDLWKDLLTRMAPHNMTYHKVKGHSDNEYNNLCDRYARAEIEKAVAGAARDRSDTASTKPA
jgi:ribonuclease HI